MLHSWPMSNQGLSLLITEHTAYVIKAVSPAASALCLQEESSKAWH